uniref:Peptidase metallopeptidase domain-containing protein n=1 Tax=Latimeria chalumnae TaxID=7897 RepID=H3ARV7_LATCH
MPPKGRAIVSWVLCHLWLLGFADGEKLYHMRDRSDIQSNMDNRATAIQTLESAEKYLVNYGWVKPVNWESLPYQGVPPPKGEDVAPPDVSSVMIEGKSTRMNVDEQQSSTMTPSPEYIQALRLFQEANGLPVTGILDEATRGVMNMPRCGVPDYKTEENITQNPVGDSNMTSLDNDDANSVGSSLDNSTVRKKRFLQQLVEHHRQKRNDNDFIDNSNPAGLGFSKSVLKWRLLGEGYSSQLTIDKQRYILQLAFRMWSEVMPLNFVEDMSSPATDIDIKLGFGTGRHLGCSQIFDGNGQVFAHAWRLGDIHFDDDEHFVAPDSQKGISLLRVAVHEIGHVLGLSHIYRPGSVMQSNYSPQGNNLELDWLDRKAIQQIYGSCEGSFNTVFDWVRKETNNNGELVYRYNTYFFRSSWYWMYENQRNRTRYGDPLPLIVGWHGLPPSEIDTFLHIWTWSKDWTLFFKGDKYIHYVTKSFKYLQVYQRKNFSGNHSEKRRHILAEMGSRPGTLRPSLIPAFIPLQVTAFNVEQNAVVSGYPKRVTEVFPAVSGQDHPIGNLDAAYFSYKYNTIFFIKGKFFWKVVDETDRQANLSLPYNGLLPQQLVSQQWYDICNVHPSLLSI